MDIESHYVRVELKVNGVVQATTQSTNGAQPAFGLQPVTLSGLLHVNSYRIQRIAIANDQAGSGNLV